MSVGATFVDDCVSKCVASAVLLYRTKATLAADEADEATVEACESPLEEAFMRCWQSLQIGADYHLYLDGQVPVGDYRLDFVVGGHFAAFPKVAIELDGHEFHEKTKEQATRRNVRDRDLQMSGWKVFHVSGSEFFRDPFACVNEVHDYAIEEARVCDAQRGRRRA